MSSKMVTRLIMKIPLWAKEYPWKVMGGFNVEYVCCHKLHLI